MRIATWNINGFRARLPYLMTWLREIQPDVVGLQELKLATDAFPHDDLAEAGYTALVHGQKAWNGVAVLVRGSLAAEPVQRGLPGQDDMGARLITAQVGELSFTTVYCPNGKSTDHEDFPRKLAWFDALGEYVERTVDAAGHAVVCGDFNIVPGERDSWYDGDPTELLFHTDAERSRLRRVMDVGLRDLYRERHPDEPGFTWWDYRAGAFHKQRGLRIDLCLATASVSERARAVHLERNWRKKIDGNIPSDHAPLWVDLD